MRSTTARILLGVAALAAAVILFVLLQDDGDDGNGTPATTDRGQPPAGRNEPGRRNPKPAKPPLPVITIRGGEPVGGIRTLEYSAGDRVRFKVSSDVADEVHVHGYDLSEDVEAGGSVQFDFPATIEGVFEAELEQRGTHILELRVNP